MQREKKKKVLGLISGIILKNLQLLIKEAPSGYEGCMFFFFSPPNTVGLQEKQEQQS